MPDFYNAAAKLFFGRAINGLWLRRKGVPAVRISAIVALLLLAGGPIRSPHGGVAALYATDETPAKAAPPSGGDSAQAPQPQAQRPPQRFGAVKQNERCVAAALHWLANHQMPDGRWSLQKYKEQCIDASCTGPGKIEADAAATSMAVLCFLAAGQTHTSNGPFKSNIVSAIDWLIAHQAANGDLSNKAKQQMYSHGLASIALGECFNMSGDKRVGDAAQKAIGFIEAAQNKKSGGWGQRAGDDGDTITFCWQMQALRSAQLAKLTVKPETLAAAKKWLDSVAKTGEDAKENGLFSEKPGGRASLTATAAGVLCWQLLQEPRTAPAIVGGVENLMSNLPGPKAADPRYWYFATVAMHNMADKNWDTWNRQMRKTLVESQIRRDCASGSWDPDKPPRDDWKKSGGRVTATALSCLTLEPYYRYLPLFKLDRPIENKPAEAAPGKEKSSGEK